MPPKFTKLYFSTAIGTFLEYFDYTLYAFSAPIIAHLFFPAANPALSLIMTWGTFSVSFLTRPLGAFIFGHYGDRIGRRKILTLSILLMAIPTIVLGLTPSYATIGVAAPISLLICRLMQGFAVSVESNGSSIYLLEMTKKYKGLIAGSMVSSCGLGVFASSLFVMAFSNHLIFGFIETWRLPFIIAGSIIGIVGIYLRRHLPETLEFQQAVQQKALHQTPLYEVLKNKRIPFLSCLITSTYIGTATYAVMVYMPSFLQSNLMLPERTTLLLTSMGSLAWALFATVFGLLTDFYNRGTVMFIGLTIMAIIVVPAFMLINTGSLILIAVALIALGISQAACDGPLVAYFSNLFTPQTRYTGIGVSFNIGCGVIGGSAPFILSLLFAKYHNHLLPGIYLAAIAFIAAVSLRALQQKCIQIPTRINEQPAITAA